MDRGAAGDELQRLFEEHYVALVRMARMLVDDPASAEDVVQESFVRLHGRLHDLADVGAAGAYLRTTVVNLARSRLRRILTARRHSPRLWSAGSFDDGAGLRAEQRAVIDALRRLPNRQRECLVLRYYLDLSEAEIADAMRISPGSVKTHAARGLVALERELER